MEKSDEIQAASKMATVGIESVPSALPSPDDFEHRTELTINDDAHIVLSWRSWVVVFITCFA
jgi:hypothetical protein